MGTGSLGEAIFSLCHLPNAVHVCFRLCNYFSRIFINNSIIILVNIYMQGAFIEVCYNIFYEMMD